MNEEDEKLNDAFYTASALPPEPWTLKDAEHAVAELRRLNRPDASGFIELPVHPANIAQVYALIVIEWACDPTKGTYRERLGIAERWNYELRRYAAHKRERLPTPTELGVGK